MVSRPPDRRTRAELTYAYAEPVFDSAALAPARKQALWRGIKARNPALAALLTDDPNLAELKHAFNARVVMTADEMEYYTGN